MTFKLDNFDAQFDVDGTGKESITLPLAVIQQESIDLLAMTKQPYAFLAVQEATISADDVTLAYTTPMDSKPLTTIINRRLIERLKIAKSLMAVKQLANSAFTTTLNPENIRVTPDDDVVVMYRGVRGTMPPANYDADVVLRQLKSAIIWILNGAGDYEQMVSGEYKVAKGTPLVLQVRDALDFDEIESVLTDGLVELQEKEATKSRIVSRLKYRIYQQVAIWGVVVALGALIAVGYWQFNVQPTQTKLADATTSFLKKDYSDVTKQLTDFKESALPTTQRYELAYSYVQSAALSTKQRDAVLNNVSLNSNEDYLNFWIQIGRGHLSDALDTAKSTEDNDLILYALTEQMAKVKADPKMSGSDREKKLDELQKSYDSYYKKRTEALNTNN